MNKTKIEIRSLAEVPSVESDSRVIRGYAIVWDVESRILWDGEEFVEVIAKGAVTEELLKRSDVTALYNHNRDYLLARSVKGIGTLSLTIDEHGLAFAFEAPETAWGNDVLALVRRGDLRGCSFAFVVDGRSVTYSRREDGMPLRRIERIAELYDVSVVVNPAYTQTSVSARCWAPSIGTTAAERTEFLKTLSTL